MEKPVDQCDFLPSIFDNYSANVIYKGIPINLQLWSTHKHELYTNLRSVSYSQADVLIICFSLVNPESLESVENLWVPDINEHCPGTPFILVGTKSNFRDEFNQFKDEYKSKGWEPIPYEKGLEMKNKLGAADYIECSNQTMKNINEVFIAAIRAVFDREEKIKQQQEQEKPQKKKKFGFLNFFLKIKERKNKKKIKKKRIQTIQIQNNPIKIKVKKILQYRNQI